MDVVLLNFGSKITTSRLQERAWGQRLVTHPDREPSASSRSRSVKSL